jgi:carbohydrate kinase (thermoresistant glucokinase family)
MRSGHPLTDEDRAPWLERLREQIKRSLAAGENTVLACSALKRKYRQLLRVNDEVKLVFLRGSCALISEQLSHRRDHFFDPALLQSQFDDLEEPLPDESALTIELGRTPQELVKEIKEELHLSRS